MFLLAKCFDSTQRNYFRKTGDKGSDFAYDGIHANSGRAFS